jgi:glutamate carboxypeptidase
MNRLSSTATNSKLLEMFNVMKPRTTFLLLLSVFFFTFSGYAQDTVEPSLNTEEIELTSWLDSQEENMLEMLERITNINSGSLNKQGVNELASIFSEELRQLGFSLSTLPGEVIEMPSCPGSDYNVDVADHILASKSGSGAKLLMMGHLDTVFPPGSPFQEFSREGDTMYGPGVSDMKGGLVVMLYALKALNESDELGDKSITVLLNSDEEMGSLSSRKYLEEQALLHDWGLVYESPGNARD